MRSKLIHTIIFIFFLSFPLIGHAQEKIKPTLITSNRPFTSNGKIEFLRDDSKPTEITIHKVESGSLNGVHYNFYYTDGSATFSGQKGNNDSSHEPYDSNWHIVCQKDPITDNILCYMSIKDLIVFVSPGGKAIVNIGHDHFPGSTVSIRIDSGKSITQLIKDNGSLSPKNSLKTIKQLRSAKIVTTRYMEWPYETWADETWEIYGFNEALSFLYWAVDHIK